MALSVPTCCGQSCRKLGAEHLDLLDHRRRRQQVRRLRHERLGDRTVQMILAVPLVLERVEDRERRRTEPQREPDRRPGLLIRELEPLLQERRDLVLFTWLCLEADQQTLSQHDDISFEPKKRAGSTPESRRSGVSRPEAGLPYLI